MIPNHEDRLVYLCNYILKNYYRNQTGASFYRINDYQTSLIKQQSKELYKVKYNDEQLPFEQHNSHGGCEYVKKEHDVQVINDGHRYNLS